MSLEDYIRKFKCVRDKLATMKKPLDDLTKVLHLVKGLGSRYKDFQTVMLSKSPYPTYNQFVLALKTCDQQLSTNEEKEKTIEPILNQAFITQHGRGRGRGRNFSPRRRNFQLGRSNYLLGFMS